MGLYLPDGGEMPVDLEEPLVVLFSLCAWRVRSVSVGLETCGKLLISLLNPCQKRSFKAYAPARMTSTVNKADGAGKSQHSVFQGPVTSEDIKHL